MKQLKFNNRILEIERKIIKDKKDLRQAVIWASSLKDSDGAIIKDLNNSYSFGESDWKKFKNLHSLDVIVLKRIPQRGGYNYLVGIKADNKYLDSNYLEDGTLILGHTFKTKQLFEVGDKIKILIEDIWRHTNSKGLHFSIHKARIKGKCEKLSTIKLLEEMVDRIGKDKNESVNGLSDI